MFIKKFIPPRLQVLLVRILRWPGCAKTWKASAQDRGEPESFPVLLTEHRTPLRREVYTSSNSDESLQKGKEENVRIASSKIDRIVIEPGEVFSYHALVGWPGRWRGFRKGLELRGDQLKAGIGGGCCALSNLLYLMAIRAGLSIEERHRHGLNMFPDHGRTVPFGCGATVFFPYADLKFSNPYSFPVIIQAFIKDNYLVGKISSTDEPGYRYRIEERDHKYEKQGEEWIRSNRIIRIAESTTTGEVVGEEEELAINNGRCLYSPEEAGEV